VQARAPSTVLPPATNINDDSNNNVNDDSNNINNINNINNNQQ